MSAITVQEAHEYDQQVRTKERMGMTLVSLPGRLPSERVTIEHPRTQQLRDNLLTSNHNPTLYITRRRPPQRHQVSAQTKTMEAEMRSSVVLV